MISSTQSRGCATPREDDNRAESHKLNAHTASCFWEMIEQPWEMYWLLMKKGENCRGISLIDVSRSEETSPRKQVDRLVHAQVLHLLKFCLKTYLIFDGTIYEQVKNTPMGSLISGFLAEVVGQRVDSLIFRTPETEVLGPMGEEEEKNQWVFLDVLVRRKYCGGLKTEVFKKATIRTQVLSFTSNYPISHKRGCVRTLYRRVETHCSETEDKIAELKYLRRVFKANGYPRNFVNRCIRKRDESSNRTDPKFWRALPNRPTTAIAVSTTAPVPTSMSAPSLTGVASNSCATPSSATTSSITSVTASTSTKNTTTSTTTDQNAPDVLTTTNTFAITIPTSSDANSVQTCPHCVRTLDLRIGLVCHLRAHRTETGRPVPGAPTHTKCHRLI
nr:unnamed protein product [Spirometra erinaceieuropaei]